MATAFDFGQLEASRREAVGPSSAAARAALLIEQAQANAVQIEAEAAARGREQGYAEGVSLALAEAEPARAALEQAVRALEAVRDEFAEQGERRAVELAVAIAEKILGAAFEVDQARICDVVAGALRRAVARDHVVLEVNPDDLEVVRGAADDVAAKLGGVHRIEVVAERRVGRGGCIVRTGSGEVDARIETQLERAAEVLRESLGDA
jgi:flagellar assembly protein FliH